MKKILYLSMIIATVSSAPSYAGGVAGEWTKCIMYLTSGKQVNVVNGQYSQDSCFKKGRKCAEGFKWSSSEIKYFSNPVIVNAPYERCVN